MAVAARARRAGPRRSKDERRTEVLRAAAVEFAKGGLHGTSTETIADSAGISHAYVFRLFGTKKALFIEAVTSGMRRVVAELEQNVSGETPVRRLLSLALVWARIQQDQVMVLDQLQSVAACSDPEIREVVARETRHMYARVRELTGANDDQLRSFFAQGALVNMTTAIGAPELAFSDLWARSLLAMEHDAA